MSLKKETILEQEKLAQYCRDGKLLDIEGASSDRLPHYRRLVYNVMYGILEKAFPIAKSILSEPDFKRLVDIYLTDHNAQESQVWKVPGEFYKFCAKADLELNDSYPYLIDLLKLEWMEILVYNREDRAVDEIASKELVENHPLVLNPDYEILDFEYPVFKGDWKSINGRKGKYFLLTFRQLDTLKVQFLEITKLHVYFLKLLIQHDSFGQAIQNTLIHFELNDSPAAAEQIMAFAKNLREKGYILGSK